MKRIANEQLIMKVFQEITSHVTLEKMIELLAKNMKFGKMQHKQIL